MPPRLEPIEFASLAEWPDDDHLAAFQCFDRSARAIVAGRVGVRAARPPTLGLIANARAALETRIEDAPAARAFFELHFRPSRVVADGANGAAPDGLLTSYYEPCVAGSLNETHEFRWPILARPADLVAFAPDAAPQGFPEGVSAARRRPDGSLVPYYDRKRIEKERRDPIVWLRDSVEAFLIQVQGSAQVEFPDGSRGRLVYDGRNGLPYTSIGKVLIDAGAIPESAMSLASLKGWLRAAGPEEGGKGLAVMRRNRSFVFFKLIRDFDPESGPEGGAGVALTPLRSIAVDRALWAYGLPFWIEAESPWADATPSPFRRLTVAQDTGSAIIGAARADLFFGSGEASGARAGSIRRRGKFVVLLPVGDER
jgi:membrane-bound lytic murein transglycosylase A